MRKVRQLCAAPDFALLWRIVFAGLSARHQFTVTNNHRYSGGLLLKSIVELKTYCTRGKADGGMLSIPLCKSRLSEKPAFPLCGFPAALCLIMCNGTTFNQVWNHDTRRLIAAETLAKSPGKLSIVIRSCSQDDRDILPARGSFALDQADLLMRTGSAITCVPIESRRAPGQFCWRCFTEKHRQVRQKSIGWARHIKGRFRESAEYQRVEHVGLRRSIPFH